MEGHSSREECRVIFLWLMWHWNSKTKLYLLFPLQACSLGRGVLRVAALPVCLDD
jgi:hypothetical protein